VALDASITWHGDQLVVVDGVGFELGVDPTPASAPDRLRILKPRWMVEEYLRLIERDRPARIVELGIYDGGSTALIALAARPRRLVACDLAPAAPALDAWIARSPGGGAVHPFYGVDQSDRARLNAILDAEFGTEPLDLAIDDASHLLEPSVASFEVVFPRLRPGGVFVLEDWASVHDIERVLMEHPERLVLNSATISEPPTPLTRMVFEIILAMAYTEVVADVRIARHWAEIRRGPASIDAATFALGKLYGPRGADLLRDPGTVVPASWTPR
jgi:SAM-dependent methyltransferase